MLSWCHLLIQEVKTDLCCSVLEQCLGTSFQNHSNQFAASPCLAVTRINLAVEYIICKANFVFLLGSSELPFLLMLPICGPCSSQGITQDLSLAVTFLILMASDSEKCSDFQRSPRI